MQYVNFVVQAKNAADEAIQRVNICCLMSQCQMCNCSYVCEFGNNANYSKMNLLLSHHTRILHDGLLH